MDFYINLRGYEQSRLDEKQVYLINGFDHYQKKEVYKIGFSNDPAMRLFDGRDPLYLYYPFKLKIVASYTTLLYKDVEKLLHIKHHNKRHIYNLPGGTEFFLLTNSEASSFLEDCFFIEKNLRSSEYKRRTEKKIRSISIIPYESDYPINEKWEPQHTYYCPKEAALRLAAACRSL